MIVQKHLIISGRVQGVGFRAYVLDRARNLEVNGWVKNRLDGKLELIVQGKENNIKEMLSMLEEGPAWARVDNIDIKNKTLNNEITDFHIKK